MSDENSTPENEQPEENEQQPTAIPPTEALDALKTMLGPWVGEQISTRVDAAIGPVRQDVRTLIERLQPDQIAKNAAQYMSESQPPHSADAALLAAQEAAAAQTAQVVPVRDPNETPLGQAMRSFFENPGEFVEGITKAFRPTMGREPGELTMAQIREVFTRQPSEAAFVAAELFPDPIQDEVPRITTHAFQQGWNAALKTKGATPLPENLDGPAQNPRTTPMPYSAGSSVERIERFEPGTGGSNDKTSETVVSAPLSQSRRSSGVHSPGRFLAFAKAARRAGR